MHTVLRRTCTLTSRPLSLARSLSLSTSLSNQPLSERLRQRRNDAHSTGQPPKDEPPHLSPSSPVNTTSTPPPPPTLPSINSGGNLSPIFDKLTERAITANPVKEQEERRRRQKERERIERFKWDRREKAKQSIEHKRKSKHAEEESESAGRVELQPKEEGKEGKEEADPRTTGLRRRMGFSNPGRTHRGNKKASRIARLAAGGKLTEGEKEKLENYRQELKALQRKRARMVPWDRLSEKLKKIEVYKIEKRIRRDEERKQEKLEKYGNNGENEAVPSIADAAPIVTPSPSATFDESVSSVTPSSATSSPPSPPLPIIHHGSRSPYLPPTAPSPVVPTSSDITTTPSEPSSHLSELRAARLKKELHSLRACKAWNLRRSTIDRQIKDLETAIAGYAPPLPQTTTKGEGRSGPEVPKLEKRDSPPLLTQFVDKLQVSDRREGGDSEPGKGQQVGSTEEAPKMLMQAVEESNERREHAAEGQGKRQREQQQRRGRISPRMEREERLRIARSQPYRDHPALQPQPPLYSSTATTTVEPPSQRTLSSYPHTLSPSSTPFSSTPSPLPPVPIAQLSHSLSRTLFNPGVHFLRDPRSGVYNFSPEVLENVPKLQEFEFGKLPRYVTSSKDEVLKQVAKREGKMFSGSTSSTVGMLCQIYFWLSKGKQVNTSMLSEPWAEKDRSFSMGQQLPVSVVLNFNPEDGTYSIDADKSFDATSESNVLADYGHLMEKLLTTDPKEFKRFLVGAEDPAPSEADHRQAYHYAITDNMVLRSQLDAVHEYLPGNGTFDLKTRGTVAIRQDRLNYEESAGYKIDRLRGPWESFEREYYDLIRSAFLKYQFQARIGCMDGIFVAYHSTARFYGFQYLPISEMDEALFDTHETGQQVFKLCIGMLERLLKMASECFEGRSVNVTWANDSKKDVLRLFVTPQERNTEEKEDGEGQNKLPMTVLEVRGTNYLDGEISLDPVVIRPSTAKDSVDGELPVWQVGYEVTKSTGQQPEGGRLLDSPRQLDSTQISDLFNGVRETQKMFSSLMLPTGITQKDVNEAAERAKESGVELDASDLSIRFPLHEGVTYRGPSFAVRDLRRMSREGTERTRKEEEKRDGDKIVVVNSTFEVLE